MNVQLANQNSGSPFNNVPKWQLALLLGGPVLLFGLGGYWYWRSSSATRRKSDPAPATPATPTLPANDTPVCHALKKIEMFGVVD